VREGSSSSTGISTKRHCATRGGRRMERPNFYHARRGGLLEKKKLPDTEKGKEKGKLTLTGLSSKGGRGGRSETVPDLGRPEDAFPTGEGGDRVAGRTVCLGDGRRASYRRSFPNRNAALEGPPPRRPRSVPQPTKSSRGSARAGFEGETTPREKDEGSPTHPSLSHRALFYRQERGVGHHLRERSLRR